MNIDTVELDPFRGSHLPGCQSYVNVVLSCKESRHTIRESSKLDYRLSLMWLMFTILIPCLKQYFIQFITVFIPL